MSEMGPANSQRATDPDTSKRVKLIVLNIGGQVDRTEGVLKRAKKESRKESVG
jgi:hypothetical protein